MACFFVLPNAKDIEKSRRRRVWNPSKTEWKHRMASSRRRDARKQRCHTPMAIPCTLRVIPCQSFGLNRKKQVFRLAFFLVRQMGLEPIRQGHTPLKRACLPIPALPHMKLSCPADSFYIIAPSLRLVNTLNENFFRKESDRTRPCGRLHKYLLQNSYLADNGKLFSSALNSVDNADDHYDK